MACRDAVVTPQAAGRPCSLCRAYHIHSSYHIMKSTSTPTLGSSPNTTLTSSRRSITSWPNTAAGVRWLAMLSVCPVLHVRPATPSHTAPCRTLSAHLETIREAALFRAIVKKYGPEPDEDGAGRKMTEDGEDYSDVNDPYYPEVRFRASRPSWLLKPAITANQIFASSHAGQAVG